MTKELIDSPCKIEPKRALLVSEVVEDKEPEGSSPIMKGSESKSNSSGSNDVCNNGCRFTEQDMKDIEDGTFDKKLQAEIKKFKKKEEIDNYIGNSTDIDASDNVCENTLENYWDKLEQEEKFKKKEDKNET